MKVTVDCPACSSGNYFQIDELGAELSCDDCGFVLSKRSRIEAADLRECVFCGSTSYYHESPFSLSFLGRHSVCYVCEATYKNLKIDTPDPSYIPASHERAQQTPYAQRWQERVDEYLKSVELMKSTSP